MEHTFEQADHLDDQIDAWQSELLANQSEINRLYARQTELISSLDPHQLYYSAGDRNATDWLSATLDISPQTAARLRAVAQSEPGVVKGLLGKGEIGLDRCYFLTRLSETGLSKDDLVGLSETHSLGMLFGLWEKRRRVTESDSRTSFEDRYLVIQPSLDHSAHKFWGLAFGPDGDVIANALHRRETELPVLEDQTSGQRRLDALAAICLDSITGRGEEEGSERRAVMVAEVFIDGALAAETNGEAGVALSSGPRLGPDTLSEILCGGKVRVIAQGLKSVSYSDLSEAIPPAIRSLVFYRDQGQCSIEGCRSRYRLQVHHIQERRHGGDHHPDNLITLCWYHHHVAIHGRGMEIDPGTPVHRRRLRWPQGPDPPLNRRCLLNQSPAIR